MRKSLLFIPGNNPAMLQNADIFESDAIIIDLEDSVNVTEKDNARNLVKYFLIDFNKNSEQEIIIRINGLDTIYYLDDIEAIIDKGIDTIMLPKASVNNLSQLDTILDKYEKKFNLKKKIKILPIIELAASVLEIEIIASLKRVDGILLGAEDLATDMEFERTKEGKEINYPRSKIAFACKAYKIDAIDTPFTDTTDDKGLINDCQEAITLGMSAKACIHPNQVETVNKLFAPSEKNIEWAKKVLEARCIALKNNLGVFSVDGKMVDKPIIERAEKIIKKAEKCNLI